MCKHCLWFCINISSSEYWKEEGWKSATFLLFFFFHLYYFYHSLLLWDLHLKAFPLRTCIHKKDAALVKGLSFSTEFAAVAPYSVSDLQPCHVVKFVVNFEEFLAICLLPKHSADTQMRCRWDQMCAYDSCTNEVVGKLAHSIETKWPLGQQLSFKKPRAALPAQPLELATASGRSVKERKTLCPEVYKWLPASGLRELAVNINSSLLRK